MPPRDDGAGEICRAVARLRHGSRLEEIWYGQASPLYDWMAWWCFLPLGGEHRCRREFVRWLDLHPGQQVLSLCCGTGSMERHIVDAVPEVDIVAIDLGPGQIARARRKVRSTRLVFRVGDAAATGLPARTFDRVLITLALHEMPADLRRRVLGEAARVCQADGRVVAIEHGRPPTFAAGLLRHVWWFTWVPGNPEAATTRDLQQSGLAAEMRSGGLNVVETHATRWNWIEGVVSVPSGDRSY
jgi:ubiquinone/menaquinone biosynthesis C-methylase UbiE